jgi:uncharacterized cupin superfamily protein
MPVRNCSGPACAPVSPGMGDAHRFVNRSGADVLLLVAGDRGPDYVITYPDIEMHAGLPKGKYVFAHKDGTPY